MNEKVTKTVRTIVPTVSQLLAVAAVIVTGYIMYNMGASHGGHSGDSHATGHAAQPTTQPANGHDHGHDHGNAHGQDNSTASPGEREPLGYACAMNCLPPLEEPGPCPICGMEMQPVYADDDDDDPGEAPERRMTMTAAARALANVQTTRVERRPAMRQLRLVGTIGVDPTRRARITTDVPGRIDALYANFEGAVVEQGQELAVLYSPDLLAVQEEFLQARRSLENLPENAHESLRQSRHAAVDVAHDRLRLSGLLPEQIDEIAAEGIASERVVLKSPIGGTVIERLIDPGEYVPTGGRVMTIADLSTVWAELEAYESDLTWLRTEQHMTFTTRAFPGKVFHGQITYIDPIMRGNTRTARVRVDVENPEGVLLPGMYVTGLVDAMIEEEEHPLIIPASAPLITGKRAVVYVEVPERTRPTFDGREVVLGPRTRDGYVVLEGLAEGEYVVTNGAFQIDSSLQIIARPSMMSPEGGPPPVHDHGDHDDHDAPAVEPDHDHAPAPVSEVHEHPSELPANLASSFEAYFAVQTALAADDFDDSREAYRRLVSASEGEGLGRLHDAARAGAEAEDITAARRIFEDASIAAIDLVKHFGHGTDSLVRLAHCPMAFDWEGADWLQTQDEIRNPYFGAEMLVCGVFQEEFPAQ